MAQIFRRRLGFGIDRNAAPLPGPNRNKVRTLKEICVDQFIVHPSVAGKIPRELARDIIRRRRTLGSIYAVAGRPLHIPILPTLFELTLMEIEHIGVESVSHYLIDEDVLYCPATAQPDPTDDDLRWITMQKIISYQFDNTTGPQLYLANLMYGIHYTSGLFMLPRVILSDPPYTFVKLIESNPFIDPIADVRWVPRHLLRNRILSHNPYV